MNKKAKLNLTKQVCCENCGGSGYGTIDAYGVRCNKCNGTGMAEKIVSLEFVLLDAILDIKIKEKVSLKELILPLNNIIKTIKLKIDMDDKKVKPYYECKKCFSLLGEDELRIGKCFACGHTWESDRK